MHPDQVLTPTLETTQRNEFLRQRAILDGEALARFIATGLGYGVTAFFLPLWLVVPLAAGNFLAEAAVYALTRDIEPLVARGRRYRAMLACTFLLEACFVLSAGVMWHMQDPYVKALAVGLAVTTMMHVATVRAIHLPTGLSAAAAIWVTVLTSNTLYWVAQSDWTTLAVTTFCALITLGYFISVLVSNHRLHRETSAGWAEALEANAAKTRFLAQMSHELRTPLNAIVGLGHAELARDRDPLTRERMQLLVESASGLGVLLDDILDMAAVQEGRLPIRPAPISPSAAITATVALFRPQAEAAGIDLRLSFDASLPAAVLLDGQRLRQCLSNVLSNALKHTVKGSIRVMASATLPGMLCIEVADTGPGIPDALKATIFEPFQRGPGPQAGAGLGLTISRTLARRMGGDLTVVPSPRGARFRLTLTFGPAALADLAPEPPAAPLNLAGRHVLVVDDIATNRLVAATYLRLLGATVTEADSGEAALAMAARRVPCAILLDMNMPGIDGVETLRRLRTMGGAVQAVPVIAMTADATEAHRTYYLACGMDGYVAKPLSPDRLTAALRPHLTAVPPRAAAR